MSYTCRIYVFLSLQDHLGVITAAWTMCPCTWWIMCTRGCTINFRCCKKIRLSTCGRVVGCNHSYIGDEELQYICKRCRRVWPHLPTVQIPIKLRMISILSHPLLLYTHCINILGHPLLLDMHRKLQQSLDAHASPYEYHRNHWIACTMCNTCDIGAICRHKIYATTFFECRGVAVEIAPTA